MLILRCGPVRTGTTDAVNTVDGGAVAKQVVQAGGRRARVGTGRPTADDDADDLELARAANDEDGSDSDEDDLPGTDTASEAEPDAEPTALALDDDDAEEGDDDDPDAALDVDLDKIAGQCTGREMSIRRAIEERREARRLRDDLDYLDFDD